jgi:hypothetical protein
VFQKDEQDILSNIYDKRQDVLDAKKKLEKRYLEENPQLKRVTTVRTASNMIPMSTSRIENGQLKVSLDKKKSAKALNEVEKYMDVAEQNVNLQWRGESSDFRTINRFEKDNSLKGERTRSKPLYSYDAYTNPQTGETEGGYVVKYTWSIDGEKEAEAKAVIPEKRLNINKFNDLGEKKIDIAVAEEFARFKDDIMREGLSSYVDETGYYIKDFSNNYGKSMSNPSVASLSDLEFIFEGGKLKAYKDDYREKTALGGEVVGYEKTGTRTLIDEDKVESIVMKNFIEQHIRRGEEYRTEDGHTFTRNADNTAMIGYFPGGIRIQGFNIDDVYMKYNYKLEQLREEAKKKKSKK